MTSFELKIKQIKELNLYRKLISYERKGRYLCEKSHKYVSFACNDYLGLAQNKAVKKAAIKAIKRYGVGSAASRLVTGNNKYYDQAEKLIAKIKNTDKALIFGSGYLTAIGTISALVGRKDLIIADKLIHSSSIDGALLSRAKVLRFAHNDVAECQALLKKHRKSYDNCLLITETIFSMDGDLGRVGELLTLAEKHDCMLLTDDAHGLGVIEQKHKSANLVQMGTLSKAAGLYGGYVAGDKQLIDYLTNKAKSLIYSTALPYPILAAMVQSLKIIEGNKALCCKPLENAKLFCKLAGLAEPESQIVNIIIGDDARLLEFSEMFKKEGFLLAAIRPPTVPKNTARLRISFSAQHKRKDIIRLAKMIKAYGFLPAQE